MRKAALMMIALGFAAGWLRAQQTCASISIVMNTPEDKLMLAVNGASSAQEQAAALEKFAQEHADSKFMPCVDEYLTRAYLQLKQYDKAITAGQAAVAAHYLDVNFLENLLQAYIASGRADSQAFDILAIAPAEIQRESRIARPAGTSDAAWQQTQKQAAATAQNETDFMQYAFFQLLAHVTDPRQRVAALDGFAAAYPAEAQKNAGLLNYQYALAYTMLNQTEKADDYAEKALAADPNNVEALSQLAFDYAIERRTNFDQAEADARKVIALVPTLQKPQGASDQQFQAQQNNLLGIAHFSLGFVLLSRATGGKRFPTRAQMAPAIRELNAAKDLLADNPRLEGGVLYYLGYAYQAQFPADFRSAQANLSRAESLQSPWQSPAQALLARVRKVAR